MITFIQTLSEPLHFLIVTLYDGLILFQQAHSDAHCDHTHACIRTQFTHQGEDGNQIVSYPAAHTYTHIYTDTHTPETLAYTGSHTHKQTNKQ